MVLAHDFKDHESYYLKLPPLAIVVEKWNFEDFMKNLYECRRTA
jgi:hypothetical protein